MTKGLIGETGSECNRAKIGGTTELFGDPTIRPEKPYTIVLFPGGSVEIARCEDGTYWVHLAVLNQEWNAWGPAKVVGARIDFEGRYGDEANQVLRDAVAAGDVNHIAFRVQPVKKGG